MQRPEEKLIAILKKNEVEFTASLPCEKIKVLLQMVGQSFQHVALTREEEGVGICAGASLAGKRPAMFVQSSGIGNMINALSSLTLFYEFPLAIFVSRRGVYKEKIEAQFTMGRRLPAVLSGAGISTSEINTFDDLETIGPDLLGVYDEKKVHVFMMSPAVWEGSACMVAGSEFEFQRSKCDTREELKRDKRTLVAAPTLKRYDVIKTIAPFLDGKVVVGNLGWPSKELYAIKDQPSNFYMLGSMGLATPIGLGIAVVSPKEVVVIDGDGSLLMNPGALATAAALAPKNLTIVAIDNGAYGSTGNQPTHTAFCVDLEQVARGFGFRNTVKVSGEKEITETMKKKTAGLTFVHVLAVPGNRDVPNIPVHHREIKRQVEEFLSVVGD